jgi:hypothetical protein
MHARELVIDSYMTLKLHTWNLHRAYVTTTQKCLIFHFDVRRKGTFGTLLGRLLTEPGPILVHA